MNERNLKEDLARVFLTFAAVLSLTVLVTFAAGAPPVEALKHLFLGSLGSWVKFSHVLMAWVPLALCSCGLLYTFRINLWNIGVEGQIVAGAVCATAVLRFLGPCLSPTPALLLAFLAGVAGGGAWASFAGVLKTRGGVNEIFAGLGLNFVAQAITLWLIFGPWKRPGIASMSGTEPFDSALWLPTLSPIRISPIGLTIAIAAWIMTGWALRKTRLGLALKAIGRNRTAAYLHGLNPDRYTIIAMAFAGGFAGMAGTFQVAGVYHRLIPSISSNYGYLALLIVMLAGFKNGPVLALVLFFACLNVGSIQLPMMLQIDSSLSGIIQGALVLTTLFFHGWTTRRKTSAGGGD